MQVRARIDVCFIGVGELYVGIRSRFIARAAASAMIAAHESK
jgi:hypothetical protein